MNDDIKNSINYLNNKTNKKSGFIVPENYFEELENKVFQEENILNAAKNIPFKTPENYFDAFEATLLDKLSIEKNTTKVIPLYKRVVRLIPTAVAASVLLFIGYTFFNNSSGIINFDNITTSDIEKWYENGYINTDSDEFISAINTTDINFENETINSINLDGDTVEEYLNTFEDNTIINEIQ
ncbi:hypothetical protein ACQY1Q_09035 [Tenacibaculum sp. TC6]|uniref:hypothetical protein n=1 Tax=Tenacibaculum sp. TC6 TaxID=3423223 RepID=UPI003D366EF8